MADVDSAVGGIVIDPTEADNQSQQGSEGAKAPSAEQTTKGTGWRKQLGEDLQNESRLSKFDGEKALDKLARSYLEAETRLNKPVERPAEDASPEEWSRYRTLLGCPESPDQYDLSQVTVPDGYKLDEGTEKTAREVAHKLALTNDQAGEMLSVIAHRDAAAIAAVNRRAKEFIKKGVDALQTEWGGDFAVNKELAHRTAERFFGKEFLNILAPSGMAEYAPLMKGLAEIGRATAEGVAPRGEAPPKQDFMDHPFPFAAKLEAERKGR